MVDEWYYRLLGTEFGPVSFDLIFERARGGDLKPDDELRHGSEREWVRADSVVGLFPEPEELHDLSELDFQFAENAPAAIESAPAVPPPSSAEHTPEPEFECDFLSDTTEEPASQWCCEARGQQLGPMSWGDLQGLARRNELSPDDRVRCLPGGQWTRAAGLIGLFDRVPANAVSQFNQNDEPDFPALPRRPEPVWSPPGQATDDPLATSSAAAVLQSAASGVATPAVASPRPLMPSLYESIESSRPARGTGRQSSRSTGKSAAPAALSALLRNGKAQALVAAVILIGGTWYFAGGLFARLSAGSIDDNYKRLESIYTEFKELRNRGASADDWESFTKRAEDEQREILAELQLIGAADDPAGQKLLSAARYDLSRMLRDARTGPNRAEESYKEHLANAADRLKGLGE
jgi:hypothetical protein